MNKIQPYNPLDKINLAKSIETELLGRPGDSLSDVDHIVGSGIYVIYYSGSFPAYAPIAAANRNDQNRIPIYVGKAIPKGGRKGGIVKDMSAGGTALASRLRGHANSIAEASNLELDDFTVRHLIVDDIWIPLGENMLIETFRPVWNVALEGFGNKDPGIRRATQYKSQWDVLHPGRKAAEKLANSPVTVKLLAQRVEDYLTGKPLAKLPKILAEQESEERTEIDVLADEV